MIHLTCQSCGHRFMVDDALAGREATCPACAAKVHAPAPLEAQYVTEGTSGLAVGSLVLGILGCIPFTGIGAIILGALGLRKISRPDNRLTGRGLAIAGIILGCIGTLATCVTLPMALLVQSLIFGGPDSKMTVLYDAGNMTYIHTALQRYADAHDGKYPAHPSLLVEGNYLKPEQLKRLSSLLEGSYLPPATPAAGQTTFVYGDYVFTYTGVENLDAPGEVIIVFSRLISPEQKTRNLLFADGRIEQVNPEQFKELMRRQNDRRANWGVPLIDLEKLRDLEPQPLEDKSGEDAAEPAPDAPQSPREQKPETAPAVEDTPTAAAPRLRVNSHALEAALG